MATEKKITVELVKSLIGSTEKQRNVAKALGLTKVNQKKEHSDSATIRGMINKISHLLRVVE